MPPHNINLRMSGIALLALAVAMLCYWAAKVFVPWLGWTPGDFGRIVIYGGMGAIPLILFARRLQGQNARPTPGEAVAMVYVGLCILRQLVAVLSLFAPRKELFAAACYAFFPLQPVFVLVALFILIPLLSGRRKSLRPAFDAAGALLVIAAAVETLGHLLLYPHLYLL